MPVLLYSWTIRTLMKWLKKKFDVNYARMLHTVLNKLLKQHPTKLQLYSHLPPISQTIQERWRRHAGHCWWYKDEFMSDILLWTPTHGLTSVSQTVKAYIHQCPTETGCCLGICQEQWAIGTDGEKESQKNLNFWHALMMIIFLI